MPNRGHQHICLLLAVVMLVAFVGKARGTEWFIATDGSAAGAGTINDPWDIVGSSENGPSVSRAVGSLALSVSHQLCW